MPKRLYSLTKKKDFDNVFKLGYSSYDKILGLKTIDNHLSYNRVGIIIGTKISKKATERNKIKRQIREILRKFLLSTSTSRDMVLICLSPIKEANHQVIEQIISRLLKKQKLLN